MKSIKFYKKKSFEIRKKLFDKFYILKEGHPGSVFSILDVLLVIYYERHVRIKKNLPIDDLIMSKGHATVAQYPILNDLGVISNRDWNNWGRNHKTKLKMFGNHNIPGIKTSPQKSRVFSKTFGTGNMPRSFTFSPADKLNRTEPKPSVSNHRRRIMESVSNGNYQ